MLNEGPCGSSCLQPTQGENFNPLRFTNDIGGFPRRTVGADLPSASRISIGSSLSQALAVHCAVSSFEACPTPALTPSSCLGAVVSHGQVSDNP